MNDTTVSNWPDISIIIITKNRHELLKRAVDSILATDYPESKKQIVILEETDTPEVINGIGVEYHTIPIKNRGFGYARNTAIQYARAEIVVFTDDDCIVERAWLKEIVHPLIEHENAGATAGAVLIKESGSIGQCENILGFPGGGIKYLHAAGDGIISVPTFSACNCAIRLKCVNEAGGFDDSLRGGSEDVQLSRRIGKRYSILYNPNARVYHAPRDNLKDVLKWFIRRGVSYTELIRVFGSKDFSIFWIAKNSIFIRLFVLVFLVYCFNLPIAISVIAVLSIYYCWVLWRFRWARGYYPSHRTFFLIPLVKATMDVGMDMGVCKGFIKKIFK